MDDSGSKASVARSTIIDDFFFFFAWILNLSVADRPRNDTETRRS